MAIQRWSTTRKSEFLATLANMNEPELEAALKKESMSREEYERMKLQKERGGKKGLRATMAWRPPYKRGAS